MGRPTRTGPLTRDRRDADAPAVDPNAVSDCRSVAPDAIDAADRSACCSAHRDGIQATDRGVSRRASMLDQRSAQGKGRCVRGVTTEPTTAALPIASPVAEADARLIAVSQRRPPPRRALSPDPCLTNWI